MVLGIGKGKDDERQPTESSARRRLTIAMLLTAAGAAAVCGLCGGIFHYFQPHVRDDPAAVAPLMRSLIAITVPGEAEGSAVPFVPRGTIEWNLAFLLSLRGAYYETADATLDGELMFLEVRGSSMDRPDVRTHIERVLRERSESSAPLVAEGEPEERLVTVRGQEVPFTFERAIDPVSRRPYRLIHGILPVADRQLLIALRVRNEPPWDDAIALQMLESIE